MSHVLIIGSGLTGATAARVLADSGFSVTVLEQRKHIGGNIYTEKDQHCVDLHMYGPHIFHTNSQKVIKFVNRFSVWEPFVYAPAIHTTKGLFTLPITGRFIKELFPEMELWDFLEWFNDEVAPFRKMTPVNQEEQWLQKVGPTIYELVFKHYSERQWGMPMTQLLPTLGARVPVDFTLEHANYFPYDTFQAQPRWGYTRFVEKMVDDPRINIRLNDTWVPGSLFFGSAIIYTGMLDALFDYDLGELPYRTLAYRHWNQHMLREEAVVTNDGRPTSVYNRVIRHRKFADPQFAGVGTTSMEFPGPHIKDQTIPMYPLPTREAQDLANAYRSRLKELNIIVGGRLGGYKYINMDAAILEGHKLAKQAMERI